MMIKLQLQAVLVGNRRKYRLQSFQSSTAKQSAPLEAVETNGCPTAQIAVFKNVFSVILYVDMSAEYEDAVESDVITFKMIQDWILYTYDVSVSNSSITQVKEKCGLDKLRIDSAVLESNPKLKSKKEKYVFDAFKYFKIVS